MHKQRARALARERSECVSALADWFQRLEPSVSCRDDRVWIGFPNEGFGLAVVLGDETADGGLNVDEGVEDAALQSSPGELGEEPSTALSHELDVGVKWNVQRGWSLTLSGARTRICALSIR